MEDVLVTRLCHIHGLYSIYCIPYSVVYLNRPCFLYQWQLKSSVFARSGDWNIATLSHSRAQAPSLMQVQRVVYSALQNHIPGCVGFYLVDFAAGFVLNHRKWYSVRLRTEQPLPQSMQ